MPERGNPVTTVREEGEELVGSIVVAKEFVLHDDFGSYWNLRSSGEYLVVLLEKIVAVALAVSVTLAALVNSVILVISCLSG